ncbi:MAG: hypothetical protein ACMG6E_08140 [Candidatus Roizmanbacteria bacterium]
MHELLHRLRQKQQLYLLLRLHHDYTYLALLRISQRPREVSVVVLVDILWGAPYLLDVDLLHDL